MNNTDKQLHDITLALAGIFQAASLIRDLAKTGTADEQAFATSINSIYKIDAPNTEAVYEGEQNLRLGLIEMVKLLGNDKTATDSYISRYVISLMHIERKLTHKQDLMNTLSRRIKHTISQVKYFSNTHPTVIDSLADIYINTAGTLSYRLHVLGHPKFLNQPEILNKLRALLLAGIRSVVLWRQLGGTRWQLFLQRGKLIEMAKKILKN